MNLRLWEINRIIKKKNFGGTNKTMFILHLEFFRTLFWHSCENFKVINGEEPILTSFWSITSYRSRILRIYLKIRINRI